MMKSAKSKRQLTLLTLVLALGVAVYLNWQYAKSSTDFLTAEGVTAVNGNHAADTAAISAAADASGVTDAGAQGTVQEALPDKNYGDAQLVNTSKSGEYFEQARLTRSKTRDEALDKLQKSLKNANLTKDEKEALTGNLTAVIASITAESDIENLVKAKGFADCVAFMDGEKVNVAVKTGGSALDGKAVVQIRDIVLSKVETAAQNIIIVEVK
ncbi:MAG: SpoIIIAH-like family protein [Ruthenibacterium sp.]